MVINKPYQLSGYSINEMENQERMSIAVEEEKPMKPTTSTSTSSNSKAIWANLKPFAYGGGATILHQSLVGSCYFLFHLQFLAKKSQRFSLAISHLLKRMPGGLLIGGTYSSIRFGSFETLTRKVEALNNRMPLTLYQEACCRLISGVITASICVPLVLARNRVNAGGNRISILQDLYRKCADEGALAPWKGGRSYANVIILTSVGMLTPYSRCFNYFWESRGLSEGGSTLGAGLVSGFFASVCSIPYLNVHAAMRHMTPDANGKYPCTSFLDCAIKILKARRPLALFGAFPTHFRKIACPTMMFWFCLEAIRSEELRKGWTPKSTFEPSLDDPKAV